jgi:phosphatidylinositol alpha-1,6-mannosyltransferase
MVNTDPSRMILMTGGLDGSPGGIQRVSRSVFSCVQRETTHTCIWSSNDAIKFSLNKDRIRTECFNRQYNRMALKALFYNPIKNCKKIICWHLNLAPLAAVLAHRFRCKFTVFLHGIESWNKLSLPVKLSLKYVSLIAANSEFTLNYFKSVHPEYSEKSNVIIPLGLNEEFVSSISLSSDKWGKYGRFLLSVSRLDETYKGEETLLKAVARLSRSHPDINLVLVGDGKYKVQLENIAASLNIRKHVHFLGKVSDTDLTSLYRECHAFTLLSEGEGFGIVYLEAMYFGKPCIATSVDASNEIVQDGKTGFVVPPKDIDATVEKLLLLLEKPKLYTSLSINARQLVSSNYMPNHFVKRLSDYMAI